MEEEKKEEPAPATDAKPGLTLPGGLGGAGSEDNQIINPDLAFLFEEK